MTAHTHVDLSAPYRLRSNATVDIVSGSFGAGHDSAAREVALRARAVGHRVRLHDVVDFFPAGLGRALRASYLWQIRTVPGSWGVLLSTLDGQGPGLRQVRRMLRIASRRLGEATRGADLVVSTHPFASQVLGERRRTGTMTVPAMTYLTDASVHPLWVHPDVDCHLAWNAVSAGQARALGGATVVIDPLVPREVSAEPPRSAPAELRRLAGLDQARPTVLIVGGALGIGRLVETAEDVLASGLALPMVLCGTNEDLRRRVAAVPGAVALGWRDDLPALLRLVDVVVQNSGGFTSLEAVSAAVPLLSYRVLPGHGERNAAALDQLGAARWAKDRDSFHDLLRLALLESPRTPVLPSCGTTLLDLLAPEKVAAPLSAMVA